MKPSRKLSTLEKWGGGFVGLFTLFVIIPSMVSVARYSPEPPASEVVALAPTATPEALIVEPTSAPEPTVEPTATPSGKSQDQLLDELVADKDLRPSSSQAPSDESRSQPSESSSSRTESVAREPDQSGQVWVNTKSGVYHYPGARWYGNTKEGDYMSESEARSNGYRAAQNGQ